MMLIYDTRMPMDRNMGNGASDDAAVYRKQRREKSDGIDEHRRLQRTMLSSVLFKRCFPMTQLIFVLTFDVYETAAFHNGLTSILEIVTTPLFCSVSSFCLHRRSFVLFPSRMSTATPSSKLENFASLIPDVLKSVCDKFTFHPKLSLVGDLRSTCRVTPHHQPCSFIPTE